ncbi:TetR/AcrR family transcriptional regulator [Streptomyces physcomitrii]|uniref:TetR/AcrR family transcriptional regulator n=1 Tax=Streptomyces physcomitrii TaxID=2724184 RepID=UPI0028AB634F|nr:helix-turn-helix domain-containing protein [Streptomyces physcomitrii]
MTRREEHGRPERLSRRRAHTRAALLDAAQHLLAEQHRADMGIREITEAADVGFGTFYGHFASKRDVLEAAMSMFLEQHSVRLESAVAHLDDCAEVFAVGVRLTGRLQRNHPQVARILLRVGLPRLTSPAGLAPRARELLRAGEATGRLQVGDLEVALASAGGSLLGLMHLLDAEPHMDAGQAGDRLAANLLRMFGLPYDEAWDVATRPLPALG